MIKKPPPPRNPLALAGSYRESRFERSSCTCMGPPLRTLHWRLLSCRMDRPLWLVQLLLVRCRPPTPQIVFAALHPPKPPSFFWIFRSKKNSGPIWEFSAKCPLHFGLKCPRSWRQSSEPWNSLRGLLFTSSPGVSIRIARTSINVRSPNICSMHAITAITYKWSRPSRSML